VHVIKLKTPLHQTAKSDARRFRSSGYFGGKELDSGKVAPIVDRVVIFPESGRGRMACNHPFPGLFSSGSPTVTITEVVPSCQAGCAMSQAMLETIGKMKADIQAQYRKAVKEYRKSLKEFKERKKALKLLEDTYSPSESRTTDVGELNGKSNVGRVLAALKDGHPKTVEQLTAETGLPAAKVRGVLYSVSVKQKIATEKKPLRDMTFKLKSPSA
jgi:hypothetical protein